MRYLFTLIVIFILGTYQQSVYAQAGAKNISGVVLDENGRPMIGVNVIIKGSSKGTSTDVNGKYSLPVASGALLEFSYLGYAKQGVAVANQTVIDVKMTPDGNSIDDVIVIGYGTVRKSDLTGSVSSVKSDVFDKVGGASFQNAMAGKVSGLQVVQNSGVPGGGVTMRIRGSNSMGNSEPLYIIDGVQYDNSSMAGFESAGSSISPLSMINPSDIESMEVLKDASATAIYGSRASNGVIIITTKTGKVGKGKVSVDLDHSVMELYKRIPLLDSNEFYLLRKEAGGNVSAGIYELAKRGLIPSYDWQDILFKTGRTSNANISFSGASDKINYMVSLNGYLSEGIVPKTDFERITGRVNLSAKVTDRLTLSTNLTVTKTETSGLPTGTSLSAANGTNSIISRALRTRPTLSPDQEGIAEYDPDLPTQGLEDYTPLMGINSTTQQNDAIQTLANINLDYKIFKSLSFKVTANYTQREESAKYYQNRTAPYGYSQGGWAKIRNRSNNTFSNDYVFTYNATFNKIHRISATAGFSMQITNDESILNSARTFPNDLLLWNDMSSAANHDKTVNSQTNTKLVSWLARVNYSLMDKYLFTVTGRIDGSSKFSANNKYGYFPAVAFAWRVNNESWLKDVHQISNLKLRVSYGQTGNQAISPYESLALMNTTNTIFGDALGNDTENVAFSYSDRMSNPKLKWETTSQIDAGFDLGLFQNRLEFVVDYYIKDTKDLLVSTKMPTTTGYTSSLLNFGDLTNKGLEISINGKVFDKRLFKWDSSFNLSFNKTTLTKLQEDRFPSGFRIPWNGYDTQILMAGQELGIFWGYKTDGIRQEGEVDPGYTVMSNPVGVGDQKYVHTSEGNKLNEEDKMIIGKAQPDFTFGFNNTFSIYGIDLSVFIDGSYGNDICDMNSMQGLRFGQDHGFKEMLNRWTPENPSNKYPRVSSLNSTTNFVFSDRYIQDGSFLRIQNITLGYSLPAKIVSKIRMSKIRFFGSVQNVCTFTKYKGYSPDVSVGGGSNLMMGHDNGSYPNPTIFRFGMNLTF